MNTDNQQGTSNQAELAWLAGIIEGEGTLALLAWRRDERPTTVQNVKINAYVVIYNTDGSIVRKVDEILRGLGLSLHIGSREQKPMLRPGGGEYRSIDPMLKVSVKGMDDVYKLLTAIRPWLFGDKAARADLMLAYLERRFAKFTANGGSKRVPYDQGDMALVDQSYRLGKRKPRAEALEGLLNDYEQSASSGA